jgi:hypothetical protein
MGAVRAKLDRVDTNVEGYSAELRAYIASDPYEVVPKFDPESGWHDVLVKVMPPPAVFGLIVGEAAHNLRSVLDHLAWQLANLDGDPPEPNRVQFPICATKPDDFLNLKRLNGMREPHRAILELMQPYNAPDRPQVLEMLAWVSNTDKHRLLHTTATTGEQFVPHFIEARAGYALSNTEFGYRGILEDETKIGRVLVTPASDELQVNMQIAPMIGIAFGEIGSVVAGYPLDGFIKNLKNVIEGIVSVFDRPGQEGSPPWP